MGICMYASLAHSNIRIALMLLFRVSSVTHEKAEQPKRAFRVLQTETLYSESDRSSDCEFRSSPTRAQMAASTTAP